MLAIKRDNADFAAQSAFLFPGIFTWLGIQNRIPEHDRQNCYINIAGQCAGVWSSSSSRMRVIYHDWSATKQRPHPQSVAEISQLQLLSWKFQHIQAVALGSCHEVCQMAVGCSARFAVLWTQPVVCLFVCLCSWSNTDLFRRVLRNEF